MIAYSMKGSATGKRRMPFCHRNQIETHDYVAVFVPVGTYFKHLLNVTPSQSGAEGNELELVR